MIRYFLLFFLWPGRNRYALDRLALILYKSQVPTDASAAGFDMSEGASACEGMASVSVPDEAPEEEERRAILKLLHGLGE